MRCSVIMATYNGEDYIYDQLESIRNQSRKADEVYIVDDGSSDRTIDIISRFIDENMLSNWSLLINEQNLGWQKNFIVSMQLAHNDIIFLSDQDDVWDNKKIELMMETMESNDCISVLASNLYPLYESDFSSVISKDTIQNYGYHKIEKVEFDRTWLYPKRPGCVMCFRRELLSQIVQCWGEKCPHDLVIWSIGVLNENLYIYNCPLVYHRRHGRINTPSNAKNHVNRLQIIRERLNILEKILSNDEYNYNTALLQYYNFYKKREYAVSKRKLFDLIMLIKDIGYYPKESSWIGDIVSIFK